MAEREDGEGASAEPQAGSPSLIISSEEDGSRRRRGEPQTDSGDEISANGDEGDPDGGGGPGPPCWSPPDSPAARQQPADPREERASRPGRSRIPGRDHRRYYHEYWRSEYLMDFDPPSHGMICMVCGSALATLKLSTIKRHIRQRHPDSLLWSPADKEVIRSGWESHLSLEGGRRPRCSSPGAGGGGAARGGVLDCARRSAGKPGSGTPRRGQPTAAGRGGELKTPSSPAPAPLPGTRTLERYLNDSLHAWFRQEFLMEYEAEAGQLLCMVCGSQLQSLHLDHIKSHVLDVHPNSLVYSAEEKHSILQTWAQRHAQGAEADEGLLENDVSVKSEPETEGEDIHCDSLRCDANSSPGETKNGDSGSAQEGRRGAGKGGAAWTGVTPGRRGPVPGRGPRRLFPERWRLDYLVAYSRRRRGFACLVCRLPLPAPKVSAFRRHIRECHPESARLEPAEREALVAAWSEEEEEEEEEQPGPEGSEPKAEEELPPAPGDQLAPPRAPAMPAGLRAVPRHGHYPGKDQRRNYQVRWRLEYLMDYDCRRHGLICMVCGAALATLKVSTIKRHIQQVHPHSLGFGPDERRRALRGYNQTALRFVHSEGCFSDHGHSELPAT
ncbi:zinc finger translocation-associated protein [Lepisosteus oculatus]|uniref:zinc finger translocation-associated protein n=1 Tax=Lepisosteus oculatus TaxID=7918 RepID=UPI0035F52941